MGGALISAASAAVGLRCRGLVAAFAGAPAVSLTKCGESLRFQHEFRDMLRAVALGEADRWGSACRERIKIRRELCSHLKAPGCAAAGLSHHNHTLSTRPPTLSPCLRDVQTQWRAREPAQPGTMRGGHGCGAGGGVRHLSQPQVPAGLLWLACTCPGGPGSSPSASLPACEWRRIREMLCQPALPAFCNNCRTAAGGWT